MVWPFLLKSQRFCPKIPRPQESEFAEMLHQHFACHAWRFILSDLAVATAVKDPGDYHLF